MKRVRYTCPNATKVRGSPYYICKLAARNLDSTVEMARHLCAYQYFCPESQGWEMKVEAKTCQKRQNGR